MVRCCMCEAGVNVKVMQEVLEHKDISTTMNIYADVTKELETTEFENLNRHFMGLAQAGRKVLLVDADAQGSLTLSLGWEPDELPVQGQ